MSTPRACAIALSVFTSGVRLIAVFIYTALKDTTPLTVSSMLISIRAHILHLLMRVLATI